MTVHVDSYHQSHHWVPNFGECPDSAVLMKWHRNGTGILPPASWPCVRRPPPLLLFWNVSHHVFGLKPPHVDHWMGVLIFFKTVLNNGLPALSIILRDFICLSSSHTRVTSQKSASFLKNFCQFPPNSVQKKPQWYLCLSSQEHIKKKSWTPWETHFFWGQSWYT